MITKRINLHISAFFLLLFCFACQPAIRSGSELSVTDLNHIKELGVLDEGEEIILFASQGAGFNGLKTSGNFFTNERIASYWIDEKRPKNTSIQSSHYLEIDTIWRYPKFNALTLASYLEVHRTDGTKFKVYVSGDSLATWNFFNSALATWDAKKHANSR